MELLKNNLRHYCLSPFINANIVLNQCDLYVCLFHSIPCHCTFYCPLWFVLVYTHLIEIYNPRYVLYKSDTLLLSLRYMYFTLNTILFFTRIAKEALIALSNSRRTFRASSGVICPFCNKTFEFS